jgi:hypothetical protein
MILSPLSVIIYAIWFGLLAGFGEAAIFVIRKFIRHTLLGLPLHVVWMAPLTDMILFVLMGLFVILLSLLWIKFRSFQSIILIFSFLTLLSVILAYPKIHWWASIILSAGLAVAISRLAERFSNQVNQLIRFSLPIFSILFLLDLIVVLIIFP